MFIPFLAAATVATAFAQLGAMTVKISVLTKALQALNPLDQMIHNGVQQFCIQTPLYRMATNEIHILLGFAFMTLKRAESFFYASLYLVVKNAIFFIVELKVSNRR